MIDLGVSNSCFVWVLPLGCSSNGCHLLLGSSIHPLLIPQAHFRDVHSGDLVSSLFYEILHGRLSQTGILPSQFLEGATTFLLGCCSFLHISCHQDRGVWTQASRCRKGLPG
jgi:hypothetical protein